MTVTRADTISAAWLKRLGLAGLLIMALGFNFGASMHSIGLGLVLLAFVIQPAAWGWMLRQPEFWLAVLIAAYVLSSAWLWSLRLPETAALQWEHAEKWLKLLLFLPLAWFLRGQRGLIFVLGLVFVLGIVLSGVAVFWNVWLNDAPWPFRFGGYQDRPIAYAFYAVIGLLILLASLPELFVRLRARHLGLRLAVYALLVAIALFLLWAILASLSRGPALTLLAAAASLMFFWPVLRKQSRIAKPRRLALMLLLLLLSAGLLFHGLVRDLGERVVGEADTLVHVVRGAELKAQDRDNTSLRLGMWAFAYAHWQEHPWLGNGPGSLRFKALQDEAQHPLMMHAPGEPFDDLHNAYMQLLFEFGLIGVLLALAMLSCLLYRIYLAWRHAQLDGLFFAAVLAGIVAMLVYSLTDFRHLNHDWRAFWLLSSAAMLALGSHLPLQNHR